MSDRVLLHFHGGGYRAGSPEWSRPLTRRLAQLTGAQPVLPAYRLAPRHPFPAAVEDGLAAYRDLLGQGISPARIAVGGESAGGGLALAVLLAAQEAGLPQPAAVVGLSPWLDLTVDAPSYERCAATDPLLDRAALRHSAALYLAGVDPRTPTASPLFAEDTALARLPPVLLQSGRDEVLADDARSFGRRVAEAGGSCRVELWPDVTHAWQLYVGERTAADRAVDSVAAFLRECLNQRTTAPKTD